MVREVTRGGLGLDGVWTDDFHYAVGRMLRGDDRGFFADFRGELAEVQKTIQKGWLFEGQGSKFLGKARGTPCFDIEPPHFVLSLQNHDRIGNRPKGDRLHHGVDLARVRAATALLLCAPFTPLLFMGQEIASSAPFYYFTDLPKELGAEVAKSRRAELEKLGEVEAPDPQDPRTFERSKIDWTEETRSPGREMLALHRALLTLRRTEPAMRKRSRRDMDVERVGESLLLVRRRGSKSDPALLFVIGLTRGGEVTLGATEGSAAGSGNVWKIVLDTESKEHGGTGENTTLEGKKLVLAGPGAVVLRTTPKE